MGQLSTQPELTMNKPSKNLSKHWEKELGKHGLAWSQLEKKDSIIEVHNENEPDSTEELQEENGIQDHQFDSDIDHDWQSAARKVVDGAELDGFGIVPVRDYVHERPTWVLDDSKVQELLTNAFPRLKTSQTQRANAARWNLVIYRYFRLGQTASHIAEDLNCKREAIKQLVVRIRKAGDKLHGTK